MSAKNLRESRKLRHGLTVVVIIAVLLWGVIVLCGPEYLLGTDKPDPSTKSPRDLALTEEESVRTSNQVTSETGREVLGPVEPTWVHSVRCIRYPDRELLSNVPFRIVSGLTNESDKWHVTSELGIAVIEAPIETVSIGIVMPGFQPRDVSINEDEISMYPTSGLFGRVLNEDGTSAADATVDAYESIWELRRATRATRDSSVASVATGARLIGDTRTNSDGFYFIALTTALTSSTPIRVQTSSDDRCGTLQTVLLSGDPVLLPNITLRRQQALGVRVLSGSGQPVRDVSISIKGGDSSYRCGITDNTGTVMFSRRGLPAWVSVEGLYTKVVDALVDGARVHGDVKVSPDTIDVVFVVKEVLSSHVRLSDALGGHPLSNKTARVQCRGKSRTSFELVSSEDGEIRVPLEEGWTDESGSLEIGIYVAGYKPGVSTLDLPEVQGQISDVVLQRDDAQVMLRGRAYNEDETPASVISLILREQEYGDPTIMISSQDGRTDKAGRFEMVLAGEHPEGRFWLLSNALSSGRFGAVGPLTRAMAQAQDYDLPLIPTAKVAALLRGVRQGGLYSYWVSIIDPMSGMRIPAYTERIVAHSNGESSIHLRLPGQRVSIVSVGQGKASRQNALLYDPLRPPALLICDVVQSLVNVSGRIIGVSPEQLADLGVGIVSEGDDWTLLKQPRLDGSFEIGNVSQGKGTLCVVELGRSRICGRMELAVTDDIEGLSVALDPLSLPEAHHDR